MIIIDTTTRSLEVLLAGAVTTNQLPILACFIDFTDSHTPIASQTQTNGTTAVTAVAAPAASTQRQVKFLSVRNSDTVAATATLRYNDNGTTRIIWSGALAVGDTLLYTDGEGLRVIDTNGLLKGSISTSAINTPTFLSGQTNGRSIKVAATATPGTLLHTAVNVSGQRDRITLFATNSDTVTRKLTIEWGGTTDPDDLIVKAFVLPSSSGRYPIVQGEFLAGGVILRAFASTANVITCGGYYERVTV